MSPAMVVQYTQLPSQLATAKFIYKWVQLVIFSEEKVNKFSHYLIISLIKNEWLYLFFTSLLFFQIWLELTSKGTAVKRKENGRLCKSLYFFIIPTWGKEKKRGGMFKPHPVDWFYPCLQKKSNHTVMWQHTKLCNHWVISWDAAWHNHINVPVPEVQHQWHWWHFWYVYLPSLKGLQASMVTWS